MTCKECKTTNPIGSKFCHECGAKLPVPESALAVEEAERAQAERKAEATARLLGDAFALSEQNKVAEAIALAEEAAQIAPDSTAAYSLLASLYERSGEQEKAIHAMERVVALNPQSAADAYKLQLLKRGVHILPKRDAAKPPPRSGFADWFPVAAASASATLVVVVGILALNRNQQVPRVGVTEPSPSPTASAAAPAGPGALSAADLAAAAGAAAREHTPPVDARPDPFAAGGASANSSSPVATPSPAAPPVVASQQVATLPSLSSLRNVPPRPAPDLGRTREDAPRPVAPAPVTVVAVPNQPSASEGEGRSAGASLPPLAPAPGSGSQGSGFGNGGRLTVGPPNGGSSGSGGGADSGAPSGGTGGNPAGSGYIRISVGPPSGRSGAPAGSGAGGPRIPAAAPGGQGAGDQDSDPLSRARRLQSMGRYDEAVGAYRDALNNGAAAGETHQGIALAQQRLGDKAAARAAYLQAIAAYEAEIAAGKNVSAARRGLESCRAALEVLGGD